MRKIAIMLASVALLAGIGASAQESRSEISLQATGFFTKDATGLGTTERTTNTGGFLVGYRYNLNRWIAAEAVYGSRPQLAALLHDRRILPGSGRCPSGHRWIRVPRAGIAQAENQPVPARRRWRARI